MWQTGNRHRVGILACGLLIGGVLSAAGCGSDNPYGTVAAEGTITYDDGSVIPAERIEIRFVSQEAARDAKTHPRQGIAEVNTSDGTFSDVSTYEYGDGIIRGRHKVVAMAMGPGNVITDAIPEKYRDPATTPLEIDAEDGPFAFKISPP